MAKYKVCPRCGSHLDHGERCDCKGPVRIATEEDIKQLIKERRGN